MRISCTPLPTPFLPNKAASKLLFHRKELCTWSMGLIYGLDRQSTEQKRSGGPQLLCGQAAVRPPGKATHDIGQVERSHAV